MDEAPIDDNNEGLADEIENDPDFSLSPNPNGDYKDDYYAAGVQVLNRIK